MTRYEEGEGVRRNKMMRVQKMNWVKADRQQQHENANKEVEVDRKVDVLTGEEGRGEE